MCRFSRIDRELYEPQMGLDHLSMKISHAALYRFRDRVISNMLWNLNAFSTGGELYHVEHSSCFIQVHVSLPPRTYGGSKVMIHLYIKHHVNLFNGAQQISAFLGGCRSGQCQFHIICR